MENNTLSHYGIRGMKWGVRRYQNKDGTLTPAGKKRYDSKPDDGSDSKSGKSSGSSRSSSAPAKKSVKDMTDDELRTAVARLELEKRYKDLSPKPETPFSKKIIDEAIKPAATEATKQVARDFLTKMSKKALGLEDKGDDGEATIKALRKEVDKLDLEKRYKELTTNDETAEAVKRLKTVADKYKYEEKIREYENNRKPKDDDDDDED